MNQLLLGTIMLVFPIPMVVLLKWPRIPGIRYKSALDLAVMFTAPVILWAVLAMLLYRLELS